MTVQESDSNTYKKFEVTDLSGKKIALPSAVQGYTLIVFLRYAGCPWCNLAIHRLTREYSRLKELDCDVIAFVQSDENSINENIYGRHDLHPGFSIVADSAKKYYDQFGVSSSVAGTLRQITKIPYWLESVKKLGFKQGKIDGDLFLVPAWFLVSNYSNQIVRSDRGIDFYSHETFLPIYESLTFKD